MTNDTMQRSRKRIGKWVKGETNFQGEPLTADPETCIHSHTDRERDYCRNEDCYVCPDCGKALAAS